MNSLVSVILPVWNGAGELDRALASAVTQSHTNLEILVVDDGSSDATPCLIQRWKARDRRIRSFRQAQSGVASARNRAIAEARGEFIAPLDHDDIWAVDKIASQLAAFDGAGDHLALVSCGWARIDADHRIMSQSVAPPGEDDTVMGLARRNFIVSSSIPLLRRAAALQIGGYSEDLRAADAQGCEDYLLYLRLAERYAIAHVPSVLVGYRTSANTMSQDLDRMIRSYTIVAGELSTRHPALRAVFEPGLVRLRRQKSTRALRCGEWRQSWEIAAQILAAHPLMALSSYATAAFNVLRRLWLGQTRTSAAAHAPTFMAADALTLTTGPVSGGDQMAGWGV